MRSAPSGAGDLGFVTPQADRCTAGRGAYLADALHAASARAVRLAGRGVPFIMLRMTDPGPVTGESTGRAKKRGLRDSLLDFGMQWGVVRRGVGIYAIHRAAGGNLIASGLSYATLFALLPTLALVVTGLTLLVRDPSIRADAIELMISAFPAFKDIAESAVDSAVTYAGFGSLIAIIGLGWAASGLYLNLTRGMERFFPGKRVSGVIARVLGVLLVVLIIAGVLMAVVASAMLSAITGALGIEADWIFGGAGAVVTLIVVSGVIYGIYRFMPAEPPVPASARLPALLVGLAVGVMTLSYEFLASWLTSDYHVYGLMASMFVALLWLRLIFIALTYGAAMARYRDLVAIARRSGVAEPDAAATADVLRLEAERAALGKLGHQDAGAGSRGPGSG